VRVDAHQHFWRYSAAAYGWIDEPMRAIRRDFLPPDLAPALAAARLDGTVCVQARQLVAETDWLLALSDSFPLIRGVVGWVPLARQGSAIAPLLERYRSHPRFKGVRHVMQSEPDGYFSIPHFNAAIREVARLGLTYDLLILARQLAAAVAWIDRHPTLRIVLDHVAKPVVNGSPATEWCMQLRELARRPHVFCKFSGLVTEAPEWHWSIDSIRPYFDVALEAFGPHRLMFGSDWPVCLVASDYAQWHATVASLVQPLSSSERDAIMGGTATAFYQLSA
jgi:L-fuconolactonase